MFPYLIVEQEVCCASANGTFSHVVERDNASGRPHLPDRRLVGQVLLVVQEHVLQQFEKVLFFIPL